MSEIKGQLLGIILVLSVFATVSVAAAAIFTTMTNKVEDKVSEVTATNVALPNGLQNVLHY